MQPYLVVDELCGEYGPWALLDGSVSQQDTQASRELFLLARSFIIKTEEAEPFADRLQSQDFGDRWLLDIPEDYYVYAGEIPWCDTYPFSRETELKFVVDTATIEEPEEKLELFRDGEPLSEEETEDFWESLSDQVMVRPGMTVTWGSHIDPDMVIETALQGRRLEMKQREVLVKRQVRIYQTFRVLIPVRRNSWEGDHLAMGAADRRGNTPAKEIAMHLGLCGQPQTLDFFESDGRRASITFRYGDAFHNTQHFTYLRKDLLDRFLRETGTEITWVIWGRREYAHSGDLPRGKIADGYEDRKSFQKTFHYAPPPPNDGEVA